ncbi:MAG: ABC transporter permease, partial [Acidobacteriia bacterium]|nr:ABC transporter permease [Terriglobia bacterium]
MSWFTSIRTFASALFQHTRIDREMEEELRLHIQHRADDLERTGLPRSEAERRARIEFGGVEKVKEECRETSPTRFLEILVQDIRYAIRMLRKAPGFTAIAVLTLALGIGANTAIFSVINAVLLRPLPYKNPDQLFFLPESNPKQGRDVFGMSWPLFVALHDHSPVFSDIAGSAIHALTLTGRGDPSEVRTVVVTPDFFSVLGITPMLGRTFIPDDNMPGSEPTVILSEMLWRNKYGADSRILGSTITLDQRAFTVIGVMPLYFRSPFLNQGEQVWIPLIHDPLFSGWITHPQEEHWLPVIARLRSGISLARAHAEVDTTSARLVPTYPTEKGWQVQFRPLRQVLVGAARSPLLVLLCAVGLVLLIACANIANLLLSRATSRLKEIAIRMALGASRRRITRQWFTESVILGMLGGAAGLLLAYWGVSALASHLPVDVPQIHRLRVDAAVLGFTFVVSLAASLVFGVAPVLFAVRCDPQKDLVEGARAGQARGSQRARHGLAAAEVALAMLLLVAAGLLIRSFSKLLSVNPGFNTEHIVKAEVSLPQFQYSTPQQWTAFADDLLARLRSEPGLEDSAIGIPLPILDPSVLLPFVIVGNPPLPPGQLIRADYTAVSPRYFSVMGISLLRGRLFSSQDSEMAPPVALISEALARQHFPHENPLGRKLIFGFPPRSNVSR